MESRLLTWIINIYGKYFNFINREIENQFKKNDILRKTMYGTIFLSKLISVSLNANY